MSSIPPLAREALELARRGDIAGAIAKATMAIGSHPNDFGLRLFLATLHSRRLELGEALVHVRKAVELAPADAIARVELVRLVIGVGELDEAEQELARARLTGPEPLRLRAMILARRGQHGEAAQLLRQVVGADPRDFESWATLGGCLLANGRPELAIEPLERAVQLRPDVQKFREKWLQALVDAGQGEQALENARRSAGQNPNDASALLAAAKLEDLLQRPAQAVETVRQALAIQPDHLPALIAFAGLLERENRLDEVAEVIERIEALDASVAELPLLQAKLAFRRKDFSRALKLAQASPEALDRGARAELIGKIHDRLGNSTEAFRAFEEMNRDSDLSKPVIAARAQALRDLVDRRAEMTSGGWMRGWSARGSRPNMREPAFIIGFPRSGTTLLDTFLMGHPGICVAEEKPMLAAVSKQLGEYERMATIDESELTGLRDRYFAAAAEHVPDVGDRLLVDKYPLGAIDAALIHRLFPTAKIVFTERHPCDVVLSCFMTRFQPTATLVSFFTLEDSARLYDRVMNLWEKSRAAMPLDVHAIKYEELVANAESEVRRLIDFLGLEWDDGVTDHERTAESRSFVGTASYAQIIEPLYDRSIGRWQRYREQMEPVLPILAPWAERFGYDM
jgi:tetratricopeptide (TPR) repeat protein